MSEIRDRATEMFPSVVLTLLSMIQAIALELLWSRIVGSPHLWSGGVELVLGWLQLFVLVLGFVQIWLYHVSIVMRFRWTPQVKDALVPLVIGIFEFALIETCEPAKLGLWLLLLAGVTAVSAWFSHETFKVARAHPDNREFFDRTTPASLSDFLPAIVAVICLIVLGLWLLWAWEIVPAFAALVFAGTFLAHQIQLTCRYWHFSFAHGPEIANEAGESGAAPGESLES